MSSPSTALVHIPSLHMHWMILMCWWWRWFSDVSDMLSDAAASSQPSVRSTFTECNIRTNTGPDGIAGTLLKACADQFCDIFTDVFNSSLTSTESSDWGGSVLLYSWPRTNRTNRSMSWGLRLWAHWWWRPLSDCLNQSGLMRFRSARPDRSGYWVNRGEDEATTTLFNDLYKHLEGETTHVRLLFVDFSSAINTL